MKLDIIVPHYKEPWETCKFLFDSISCQKGVVFDTVRVIVVNDGDYCILEESLFEQYPFDVLYFVKEHEGVSAARNAGLEQSDADYIMFCDIDDGFLNNYGLHLIFSAMQEGFDYLIANFVEETFDEDGNPKIVSHNQDLTFIHGKVYRRQFLYDHDIFFDPKMTIHEDGYFNMLAWAVSKYEGKQKSITTPIYLWCWNNNSVVRSDKKDFVLRTYDHVMRSRFGICEELNQRGYVEDFETAVAMTVLNSYYDFQKNSFRTPKNRKHYEAAEKEFKRFWKKYKNVFNGLTNARVAEIAEVARQTARSNGLLLEHEDLKTFLRHIEYEVK